MRIKVRHNRRERSWARSGGRASVVVSWFPAVSVCAETCQSVCRWFDRDSHSSPCIDRKHRGTRPFGAEGGGAFHTLGGRKVTQSVSRSPFQYSLRDISVTRYSGPRRFRLFSSILITGLPTTTIERSEVIGTASSSCWEPLLVGAVSWEVCLLATCCVREDISPVFCIFFFLLLSYRNNFNPWYLCTSYSQNFDFSCSFHSIYISTIWRSRESLEFLKSFVKRILKKKKRKRKI